MKRRETYSQSVYKDVIVTNVPCLTNSLIKYGMHPAFSSSLGISFHSS